MKRTYDSFLGYGVMFAALIFVGAAYAHFRSERIAREMLGSPLNASAFRAAAGRHGSSAAPRSGLEPKGSKSGNPLVLLEKARAELKAAVSAIEAPALRHDSRLDETRRQLGRALDRLDTARAELPHPPTAKISPCLCSAA